MSIRLIALDLDGTLLNSKKELTERNRKALETCIAQGIWIVPCTGRTSMGIPDFVRGIPGVRYAITVNGGMIEDMEKDGAKAAKQPRALPEADASGANRE